MMIKRFQIYRGIQRDKNLTPIRFTRSATSLEINAEHALALYTNSLKHIKKGDRLNAIINFLY